MQPVVRRTIALLAFRSVPLLARASLGSLVVIAAACGSDSTTSPLNPAAVARVSADSQTTAVGVAMAQPLVVLVTGGGVSPLANESVTWSIVDGGGTLCDTTAVTDADGHAGDVHDHDHRRIVSP